MTEQKHTRTPWKVRKSQRGGRLLNGRYAIDGKGWEELALINVAVTDNCTGKTSIDPEGEANAAHIVECVNTHDQLVQDNKRLREALRITADQALLSSAETDEERKAVMSDEDEDWHRGYDAAISAARAALSQGEKQ